MIKLGTEKELLVSAAACVRQAFQRELCAPGLQGAKAVLTFACYMLSSTLCLDIRLEVQRWC